MGNKYKIGQPINGLILLDQFKEGNRQKFKLQCKCGKIFISRQDAVVSGRCLSCGCYHIQKCKESSTKHGASYTNEYKIYKGINERCNNPNKKEYKNYGGRGILLKLTFQEFIKEVGKRPSNQHSIERINNSGNYEKGNLKWATRETQARNRRSNRIISFLGINKPLVDWAIEIGLNSRTLIARLNNKYPVSLALTLPVGQKGKSNYNKLIQLDKESKKQVQIFKSEPAYL